MTDGSDRAKTLAWLKRAAFHYLARYSSSTDNLRKVLLRKVRRRGGDMEEEAVAALIEAAIGACREGGLVDDLSFSETKVATSGRKGLSRRRIDMLLKTKGVGSDTIAVALDEFDDRRAALRYARRRRLGPWRGQGSDRARDVGAMTRAGFPSSIAFEISAMPLAKAEEELLAS